MLNDSQQDNHMINGRKNKKCDITNGLLRQKIYGKENKAAHIVKGLGDVQEIKNKRVQFKSQKL